MLLGKASSSVYIMYKPYLHILPTHHSGQQSAIVLLLVKVNKQIQLVWYSTSNLQLNMKDLLQCNHDLTNSLLSWYLVSFGERDTFHNNILLHL